MKKKLISALLAGVLVCSLAGSALAAERIYCTNPDCPRDGTHYYTGGTCPRTGDTCPRTGAARTGRGGGYGGGYGRHCR